MLVAGACAAGSRGGAILTLSFTLVAQLVVPRERGRYQGYIASLFTVANVAGPLVGGFFVDHLSWRWLFYTTAAIAGVALLCRAPQPSPRSQAHVGPARRCRAAGLLLVSLVGDDARRHLGRPAVRLGVAGDARPDRRRLRRGALSLFVIVERSAAEPVMPIDLFRRPLGAGRDDPRLPDRRGDDRRDHLRPDLRAARAGCQRHRSGPAADAAHALRHDRQHARRAGDVANRRVPTDGDRRRPAALAGHRAAGVDDVDHGRCTCPRSCVGAGRARHRPDDSRPHDRRPELRRRRPARRRHLDHPVHAQDRFDGRRRRRRRTVHRRHGQQAAQCRSARRTTNR